ncbi:MAG: alginate O-acetyltransferase AlgF [Pseudomonadota bacterium]
MTRTTFPRRIAHASVLFFGLLALPAGHAGEGGLYGPTAPKGSAFVRLYNASNQEASATVGSASVKDIAPLGSSDFSFLAKGDYTAQVGSQSLPVSLGANQYYTLVNLPGSAPRLVEEAPFKNKQKALIRVQNLSDKTLSLKTADGKTDVIKAVAAAGQGEREINPVKVSLALFEGDTKISDLKPVVLPRGEVVSLFITGSAGNLSPVWVKRPGAE